MLRALFEQAVESCVASRERIAALGMMVEVPAQR